jgi:hypothetical protein
MRQRKFQVTRFPRRIQPVPLKLDRLWAKVLFVEQKNRSYPMKALNNKIAWSCLMITMSLSLACQRAPEQSATNDPPAETGAPAAEPAPAPVAAPAPAAPAAAPAKPAAAKPAPTKSEPAKVNQAAAPAAVPAVKPVVLDAGTAIKVRTTNTLSTKLQKSGDSFEVSLAEPIVVGGKEVVAKNAMLMGRIVDSDPGGRVKGVATMSIELNHLHTADGQMIEISTNNVSVEAATSAKKDAVKVGAATAIGAVIGAVAGGKKGAGIGAATGAGAGTAVVLGTRGDAAEIPAETVLDFSLRSPVTLPAK